MSIHFSRYAKIYSRLARPDVAHTFPRHVFVREPNAPSRVFTNSGELLIKHENVLDSTLLHLTEPFNNSEVYIIGTMNQSNTLAIRTKKLIEEIKPDVVMVQTDESWWKAAQMLRHVKSQEEMDLAKNELGETLKHKFPLTGRRLAFNIRLGFFNLYSRFFFGIPLDFNPFLPGLEMKYALEEATKLDSKIVYLGYEFDRDTNKRLFHDTRYTIVRSLVSSYRMYRENLAYSLEMSDFQQQTSNYGMRRFLESSCDQYFVNWFIQVIGSMFPDVKRILIEKREEDLFTKIMENKGKKMVILVNQIHMEGLEHHWCHHFGQTPRSVRHLEIDPIGDMPLRKMLFNQMYHVIMRDVKTSRAKSTPASLTNEINPYWRENNFQYEHRNM